VTLNGGFGVNINGGLGINLTNSGLGGITLSSGNAGITMDTPNSSTTAFTLQTAGGQAFLVGDSTDGRLCVSGCSAVSSPAVLVLGQYNGTTYPTEADGGMFYDANSDSFQCGENGAWQACTGQVFSQIGAISSNITATATDQTFNYTTGGAIEYTPPTNDCQPGVQYLISASGTYNQEGTNVGWTLDLYSGTTTVDTATIKGAQLAQNSTDGEWNYSATITCWSTTSVTHTVSVTTTLTANAVSGPAFTSGNAESWGGTNTMVGAPSTNWTNGGAIALKSHLGGSSTPHLWMEQFSVQRVGP
jgi:hypothetical protein